MRMHRPLAIFVLLLAGTASPAQQNVSDILQYIEHAWPALTRSMDECRTVTEEKFVSQPVLYVPADATIGAILRGLAQRCHITVQPLPQVLHKLGEADLTQIKQAGLLYLPNPYVVPGGFFNEMYGWDSYFIIVGLVRAGKLELARGMVENFFYEIEHYGAVLNANRTYYLTRSQPPFVSSMVMTVYDAEKDAGKDDRNWLGRAYGYIVRDHTMWTTGKKLAGKTRLSRYFDYGSGPVPESFGHEDNYYDAVARWFLEHPAEMAGHVVEGAEAGKLPASWPRYTVQLCGGRQAGTALPGGETATAQRSRNDNCATATRMSFTPEFYKADRAMRESGYDITFRFGPFGDDTHHYAAVDLNSLLYKEEMDLAQIATMLGKKEDAERWTAAARTRKEAMNRLMWDEAAGEYFDYDFVRGRRSGYEFITTFVPLWAGVASPQQAERVRHALKRFEQPGGVVTSLNPAKVQWDWPWGWAPNQYLTVQGLRRYGFNDDADRVASKFLSDVLENFRREGTIREKYNVVTRTTEAEIQAGYKQNVVGFGWTNGTFLELLHELPEEWKQKLPERPAN